MAASPQPAPPLWLKSALGLVVGGAVVLGAGVGASVAIAGAGLYQSLEAASTRGGRHVTHARAASDSGAAVSSAGAGTGAGAGAGAGDATRQATHTVAAAGVSGVSAATHHAHSIEIISDAGRALTAPQAAVFGNAYDELDKANAGNVLSWAYMGGQAAKAHNRVILAKDGGGNIIGLGIFHVSSQYSDDAERTELRVLMVVEAIISRCGSNACTLLLGHVEHWAGLLKRHLHKGVDLFRHFASPSPRAPRAPPPKWASIWGVLHAVPTAVNTYKKKFWMVYGDPIPQAGGQDLTRMAHRYAARFTIPGPSSSLAQNLAGPGTPTKVDASVGAAFDRMKG